MSAAPKRPRPSEYLYDDDSLVPYGVPFADFIGDEPDDNPAEIFDATGLIVRGEPSLFIGDPKVGKTFLIEDLALHLAAGRKEWCGVALNRRCRVLLFLKEDSERTTRRRLHQLARGAGIEHWELTDWLTIDTVSPLYFDDEKSVKRLERQLVDFDICAIDSLSTIHNGDENAVAGMAPVMNRWRDLSLGTKTAIPIVHHFRKRGDSSGNGSTNAPGGVLQRARGSSLIGATTRHAVGVDHGPERGQIVLSVESNHEIACDPFVIRRVFDQDLKGRKRIRHERVGSINDARGAADIALLDPVTLKAIATATATAGSIGPRDLRERVNQALRESSRGRGVRDLKIDESADRLANAGRIERGSDRASWRIVVCPEVFES